MGYRADDDDHRSWKSELTMGPREFKWDPDLLRLDENSNITTHKSARLSYLLLLGFCIHKLCWICRIIYLQDVNLQVTAFSLGAVLLLLAFYSKTAKLHLNEMQSGENLIIQPYKRSAYILRNAASFTPCDNRQKASFSILLTSSDQCSGQNCAST